jgi:hypothetical protein
MIMKVQSKLGAATILVLCGLATPVFAQAGGGAGMSGSGTMRSEQAPNSTNGLRGSGAGTADQNADPAAPGAARSR